MNRRHWHVYRLIRFHSWLVASALFDIRVWGRENVPRRGPVIVAANHESFLDPWMIGFLMPRTVTFLARGDLFNFPGLSTLLHSLNVEPLDSGGARSRRALTAGLQVLKAEETLSIFPEGTRSPDGTIQPFTSGVSLLAARSGAAVVPAAIRGAYEAWPRSRRLPCLHPIRVVFGQPVHYDQRFDSRAEFADHLRQLVKDLYRRIGREVSPPRRDQSRVPPG